MAPVVVSRNEFKAAANTLDPTLQYWTRTPRAIVTIEPNPDAYFGCTVETITGGIESIHEKAWGKDDEFILDFGIHMVGHLSFRLETKDAMDAPCRLRLTFGESPLDVSLGMTNVKTWISTSWLPDEVINVDDLPEVVRLPRRHSCRFVRVEVVDTSAKFKVSFNDVKFECVSAIGPEHTIEDFRFSNSNPSSNSLLRDIDMVSIFTLRDCMQSVFEDGPRRDRRLWFGDLRLQALANYSTFRDFALVKRCIYLFAAVSHEDGRIPACLFLKPNLTPASDYIVDYDALVAAIVYDYVEASGDKAAGEGLWPVVLGCVRRGLEHLNPETHLFEQSRTEDWKFLDWRDGLDHSAGVHGVLVFSLKAANALATLLGKECPFELEVAQMTAAAANFISPDGAFVSGPESQVSFASGAWLVLAEVFPIELARETLLNTIKHKGALQPLTPYLWHHVCDALALVGCHAQALAILEDHWGGMIRAGADTFWECYDHSDPRASPYGDVRNNSFCHAWSCTPTYLLRGKLKAFTGAASIGTVRMSTLDENWVRRLV